MAGERGRQGAHPQVKLQEENVELREQLEDLKKTRESLSNALADRDREVARVSAKGAEAVERARRATNDADQARSALKELQELSEGLRRIATFFKTQRDQLLGYIHGVRSDRDKHVEIDVHTLKMTPTTRLDRFLERMRRDP